MNQFGAFRHCESVAAALVEDGQQVVLYINTLTKKEISDEAIKEFVTRSKVDNYQLFNRTKSIWYPLTRFIRDLIGYHVYLIPNMTSDSYRKHYLGRVSNLARVFLNTDRFSKILLNPDKFHVLRSLLLRIPPDGRIIKDLKHIKPDVILVLSNLPWDGQELEYIRAGLKMRIPTALQILSWDNLTTKGTFDVMPDAVLLWNSSIEKEAEILHGVPLEKIIITGAPTFDYLFSLGPSCSYEDFCKKINLSSDLKYITYLGSSASISGDETSFVKEFIRYLRSRMEINILIRPHPLNYKHWSDFEEPGVVVWPRNGKLPDTIDSKQDFFDTIYHSMAVIGVNTSAMIEATIINRPCISIKAEQFRSSQSEMGHFRHLVNGGFLYLADDIGHASNILLAILSGTDVLQEKRKKFVESFIRPLMLQHSAGNFVAQAVTLLGQGENAQEINSHLLQF